MGPRLAGQEEHLHAPRATATQHPWSRNSHTGTWRWASQVTAAATWCCARNSSAPSDLAKHRAPAHGASVHQHRDHLAGGLLQVCPGAGPRGAGHGAGTPSEGRLSSSRGDHGHVLLQPLRVSRPPEQATWPGLLSLTRVEADQAEGRPSGWTIRSWRGRRGGGSGGSGGTGVAGEVAEGGGHGARLAWTGW